ncbi:neurofilament heavy polypeptide [Gouania willdenowi]|uniref:Neurofilament heavy polypeptide-like n=1 Tax=Gouania willdenowi TaxID=441366 RepID=A0A8C5HLL4_GOUWI|nr:neurofilament heavy polypeptide-like [Gouania willdenowi]
MAIAYGTISAASLLSMQYPPPLLPKPGKDNVRLQKLLKRTAKKKTSAQASQTPAPFRSCLSPVNEASPDLEHSDTSTPPKTPETPINFYNTPQAQRFTVRPLYQHVASPYPQRAAYGRLGTMSPQTVADPLNSSSLQVSPISPFAGSAQMSGDVTSLGQVDQLVVSAVSRPAFSITESALRAVESTKSQLSSSYDTPFCPTLAAAAGSSQFKFINSGPPSYPTAAVIQPLTVLMPLAKSRSPRPTFKATETSKSPKPMFDVPQIRMYTASTSYYETSRTPPVYDSSGLTAIGGTISQTKTQTEMIIDVTPTTPEPQRKTPTLVSTTPALDTKRATPTSEIKGPTPTLEIKRATPTSEIRVKTPTYDFEKSRITAGRPRTPGFQAARATTPVFEISKPNPLLFAVTSVTVEPKKTSKSKTTELPDTLLNGDIHTEMTFATKQDEESVIKTKSESDSAPGLVPSVPVGSLTSSSTEKTSQVSAYQRPKTPTFEAARLMSTSPAYKRPKTPTFGTPRQGVSPVASQRPKTPTQGSQKSSYRGLTPAEYAAYGGIKTYSPAFGIASSTITTQEGDKPKEDVMVDSKTPSRDLSVKEEATKEVSTVKEALTAINKAEQNVEQLVSIPSIVVSQASESPVTMTTQETRRITNQFDAKQEVTAPSKALKAHAEDKTEMAELQKVETADNKTNMKTSESSKISDPDPLKAVKKLFSKNKAQTTEQVVLTEKKSYDSKQRDQEKPPSITQAEPQSLKTRSVAPELPINTQAAKPDAESKEKAHLVSAVIPESGKRESLETLPVAEPVLKVLQKPKGLKNKPSGWSRLKKHMVVEQEEPKFPEAGSEKEVAGQERSEVKKEDKMLKDEPRGHDENPPNDAPKATKMWEAVLFQMFSSKENIMHQIELSKNEKDTEKKKEKTEEVKEIPSFAYRLPVLLFSPKFDAKRLKEAASRPVTKISTVFEMGLIGRKGKEEEPKDFNRKARGFAAS